MGIWIPLKLKVKCKKFLTEERGAMGNAMSYFKAVIPTFLKIVILRFIQVLLRFIQRTNDFHRSLTSEVPYFVNPLKKYFKSTKIMNSGKVYDCFLFFNELDLLELRLNILNEYVDYFVIYEATITFTGKSKPLLYLENIERFSKFHHKIIYVHLDWSPVTRDDVRALFHKNSSRLEKIVAQRTLTNPNVPQGEENNHWLTEFFQKESFHFALAHLKDEDIVYQSDLDEIWNPGINFEIKKDKIYVFKQKPYIYFLNNRSNEHWHNWNGSIVSRFGTIKNLSLNDARTHRRLKRSVILNGGWHFSFQGGLPRILEKLDSYGHQELNTLENRKILEVAIVDNFDFRGRKGVAYRREEKGLPIFLLNNRDYYSKMFL